VTRTSRNEVDLLREQLSTERYYSEQLRNAIYFAGSIVLTLALVLVAYGWYANFRVYERDKAAIRDELRQFLANEIGTSMSTLRADIDGEQSRVKKDYESLRISVEQTSTAVVKNLLSPVYTRLRELQFGILQLEMESWRAQTVHANVVGSTVTMLELATEMKSNFRTEVALEELLKGLNDLDRSGVPLEVSRVSEAETALAKLPSGEHVSVREAIQSMLRKTSSAI